MVTTLETLRAYLNSPSLDSNAQLQLVASIYDSLIAELEVRHRFLTVEEEVRHRFLIAEEEVRHRLLIAELEVHRRRRLRRHPWTSLLGCFRRNRNNRTVIADNSAAGEQIIIVQDEVAAHDEASLEEQPPPIAVVTDVHLTAVEVPSGNDNKKHNDSNPASVPNVIQATANNGSATSIITDNANYPNLDEGTSEESERQAGEEKESESLQESKEPANCEEMVVDGNGNRENSTNLQDQDHQVNANSGNLQVGSEEVASVRAGEEKECKSLQESEAGSSAYSQKRSETGVDGDRDHENDATSRTVTTMRKGTVQSAEASVGADR